MVAATLKRTLVSILVLIGSGLWVAALLIMAQTVQQSAHFSDLHPFIVGVNVAGLLVLLILIGGRVDATDPRLAPARGRLAPGSAHGVDVRDARALRRCCWCSTSPSYFSIAASTAGSTSRFAGPRRRADAVARGARSAHARVSRAHARHGARSWRPRAATRSTALDELRREHEALELTLLGANSRIIAASSDRLGEIVPSAGQRGNGDAGPPGPRLRDARSARRRRLPRAHRGAGSTDECRATSREY